MNIAFLKFSN